MRFHSNWPVKRSCKYILIHMQLVYLLSGGNRVICFVLIHWSQLKLWIISYDSSWKYSLNSFTWKFFHESFDIVISVCVHICYWWLYMFMCVYVVGDYICLCAYMLLVIIYVVCIYVVGEFFYMLLVVNCWCKHVLEYVGVNLWNLYEVCFVVVES